MVKLPPCSVIPTLLASLAIFYIIILAPTATLVIKLSILLVALPPTLLLVAPMFNVNYSKPKVLKSSIITSISKTTVFITIQAKPHTIANSSNEIHITSHNNIITSTRYDIIIINFKNKQEEHHVHRRNLSN